MSKDLATVEETTVLLNNLTLSIKTEEDFSKYMAASQRLSRVAKLLDENIRKIGSKLMYENDVKLIENDDIEIKYIEPTEIDIFSPRMVVEALGMDRAVAFLQVKGGDLKKYLRKGSAVGAVTMEELEKAQKQKTVTRKKGYVKVTLKI